MNIELKVKNWVKLIPVFVKVLAWKETNIWTVLDICKSSCFVVYYHANRSIQQSWCLPNHFYRHHHGPPPVAIGALNVVVDLLWTESVSTSCANSSQSCSMITLQSWPQQANQARTSQNCDPQYLRLHVSSMLLLLFYPPLCLSIHCCCFDREVQWPIDDKGSERIGDSGWGGRHGMARDRMASKGWDDRRGSKAIGDASVGNSIPSIPFVAEFEVVGIWID